MWAWVLGWVWGLVALGFFGVVGEVGDDADQVVGGGGLGGGDCALNGPPGGVSVLLGVFRTVLVLCFRLPSSGPGNRFRPRRECDTLGLSEDEYDCISARSMRQYP